MYRWKGNAFFRFCPEPYYPFNPKNTNKYVVSETHKPFWEIPSLAQLTEKFNFSAQDAFNYHLTQTGHDVKAFWEQVDDAIVSTTLSKVKHMARYTRRFLIEESQVEFFDLLRFDFIMREEGGTLKLYLMEVCNEYLSKTLLN